MHISNRLRNVIVLLPLTIALTAAAPARGITIDGFTDPFPPNPDLPASGSEILFVGTWCDGGACPPGALIEHLVSDSASQTGLAGVLGGARDATVSYVVGTAYSAISPSPAALSFNHNAGASAILELHYGAGADLNADLTALHADALEFHVGGDMYSGPRPVPCTITISSGLGSPSAVTASSTQELILDGTYTYPFADFAGVDFTDVDRISIVFDASAVTAVDFALGPIQTNDHTVPVEPSSWGAIKTTWR